jgi:hypothetical protein
VNPPRIPIDQQIREMATVISETDAALARMVSNHKMRTSERDYRMNRLHAIKRTLEWAQANQDDIVEFIRARRKTAVPTEAA